MTDILDLLILILLINLLAMVGSSRTGGQQGQRATLGDLLAGLGKYLPWFGLIFVEVFGGWFLFPAVITKIAEIVALHPELASGPNGFIIAALPFVMAVILALMPISFLLSRRNL